MLQLFLFVFNMQLCRTYFHTFEIPRMHPLSHIRLRSPHPRLASCHSYPLCNSGFGFWSPVRRRFDYKLTRGAISPRHSQVQGMLMGRHCLRTDNINRTCIVNLLGILPSWQVGAPWIKLLQLSQNVGSFTQQFWSEQKIEKKHPSLQCLNEAKIVLDHFIYSIHSSFLVWLFLLVYCLLKTSKTHQYFLLTFHTYLPDRELAVSTLCRQIFSIQWSCAWDLIGLSRPNTARGGATDLDINAFNFIPENWHSLMFCLAWLWLITCSWVPVTAVFPIRISIFFSRSWQQLPRLHRSTLVISNDVGNSISNQPYCWNGKES